MMMQWTSTNIIWKKSWVVITASGVSAIRALFWAMFASVCLAVNSVDLARDATKAMIERESLQTHAQKSVAA
jgi:hypothetical protein